MTAKSTTTITVTLLSEEVGIISSALKYAGDMQKKYSVSPNCFERVHIPWNNMLKKVGNDILFGVHLPDEEPGIETDECLSTCFKTMTHSPLCQHYKEK